MAVSLAYDATTLTLDVDGKIIHFEATQNCDVAVPEWINQNPSIDTNVWSKSKEILTYVVRLSDVGIVKLDTLQASHTLINYNDSIYGKSSKQVWINNVTKEWQANIDWSLPWHVVITLVLVN